MRDGDESSTHLGVDPDCPPILTVGECSKPSGGEMVVFLNVESMLGHERSKDVMCITSRLMVSV